MRMRKKKWAEGWMEEHSDYITSTPQDYKGKWKECSFFQPYKQKHKN